MDADLQDLRISTINLVKAIHTSRSRGQISSEERNQYETDIDHIYRGFRAAVGLAAAVAPASPQSAHASSPLVLFNPPPNNLSTPYWQRIRGRQGHSTNHIEVLPDAVLRYESPPTSRGSTHSHNRSRSRSRSRSRHGEQRRTPSRNNRDRRRGNVTPMETLEAAASPSGGRRSRRRTRRQR